MNAGVGVQVAPAFSPDELACAPRRGRLTNAFEVALGDRDDAVLLRDDEIHELIFGRVPNRRLKEAARRNGFRSLREMVIDMVAAGDTSLQEPDRVTLLG